MTILQPAAAGTATSIFLLTVISGLAYFPSLSGFPPDTLKAIAKMFNASEVCMSVCPCAFVVARVARIAEGHVPTKFFWTFPTKRESRIELKETWMEIKA